MDEFLCTFCDRARRAVRKLISGPRVFVCDGCVLTFVELASDGPVTPREPLPAIELLAGGARAAASTSPCSFCGKKPQETRFSGFREDATAKRLICDECLALCIDILAEEFGGEWDARVDSWPHVAPSQHLKPQA